MAMIYTSGIIHFADSEEVFNSLPNELKNLLKEMPATWDKTEAIVAEPGKSIVLSRKKDNLSYIIGINGTNTSLPVFIDLTKYGKGYSKFRIISEGKDPLMDFKVETHPIDAKWKYNMAPKGGFIIEFVK
ncbi:glycoside hydrolase family 97 C-terminal domain-containing protein [Flavobacterium ginsengisoli]